MKVLVISGCSASKAYDGGADCELLDERSYDELLNRDADRVLPAREMYTGREHVRIDDAVTHLRSIDGVSVDWCIISAGYGVVDSTTEIAPYDCTLSSNANKKSDYQRRGRRLGVDDQQTVANLLRDIGRAKQIPAGINAYNPSQYDLLFVILGYEYLLTAGDALNAIPETVAGYAFVPDSRTRFIGSLTQIPTNERERATLDVAAIAQKGTQFQTLTTHLETTNDLRSLRDDPSRVHSLSIQPRA